LPQLTSPSSLCHHRSLILLPTKHLATLTSISLHREPSTASPQVIQTAPPLPPTSLRRTKPTQKWCPAPHYRNHSGRDLRPRIYHNPLPRPNNHHQPTKKASTVPPKHPNHSSSIKSRSFITPPSITPCTSLHNAMHLHDAPSQNYSPTMTITTSPYTQHQYHTHSTSTSHHSPPWHSVATYETSLCITTHVPTTPYTTPLPTIASHQAPSVLRHLRDPLHIYNPYSCEKRKNMFDAGA